MSTNRLSFNTGVANTGQTRYHSYHNLIVTELLYLNLSRGAERGHKMTRSLLMSVQIGPANADETSRCRKQETCVRHVSSEFPNFRHYRLRVTLDYTRYHGSL